MTGVNRGKNGLDGIMGITLLPYMILENTTLKMHILWQSKKITSMYL